MRAAASRTFWTAGSNNPIRMAMMAMTTNNSISVNARRVPRVRRSIPETFGSGEKNERSDLRETVAGETGALLMCRVGARLSTPSVSVLSQGYLSLGRNCEFVHHLLHADGVLGDARREALHARV